MSSPPKSPYLIAKKKKLQNIILSGFYCWIIQHLYFRESLSTLSFWYYNWRRDTSFLFLFLKVKFTYLVGPLHLLQ